MWEAPVLSSLTTCICYLIQLFLIPFFFFFFFDDAVDQNQGPQGPNQLLYH